VHALHIHGIRKAIQGLYKADTRGRRSTTDFLTRTIWRSTTDFLTVVRNGILFPIWKMKDCAHNDSGGKGPLPITADALKIVWHTVTHTREEEGEGLQAGADAGACAALSALSGSGSAPSSAPALDPRAAAAAALPGAAFPAAPDRAKVLLACVMSCLLDPSAPSLPPSFSSSFLVFFLSHHSPALSVRRRSKPSHPHPSPPSHSSFPTAPPLLAQREVQ